MVTQNLFNLVNSIYSEAYWSKMNEFSQPNQLMVDRRPRNFPKNFGPKTPLALWMRKISLLFISPHVFNFLRRILTDSENSSFDEAIHKYALFSAGFSIISSPFSQFDRIYEHPASILSDHNWMILHFDTIYLVLGGESTENQIFWRKFNHVNFLLRKHSI